MTLTPFRDHGGGGLLFASDEDMMDDSSVTSSAAAAGLSSAAAAGQCTPRSRRLFEEDFAAPRPSPPRSRRTLKPLDLNDVKSGEDGMSTAAAAQQQQMTQQQQHGGRKRSSGDRNSTKEPGQSTPVNNNNRLDSSTDSDHTMYSSPHISPASFMTMDGRFVQSKNPFSSPMVTESVHSVGGGSSSYSNNDSFLPATTAAVQAPTFPVCFESKMPSILPPRHHRLHKRLPTQADTLAAAAAPAPPAGTTPPYMGATNPSLLLPNGGYPTQKYQFTGSPIAEQGNSISHSHSHGSGHRHNGGGGGSHTHSRDSSDMETGSTAATSGSLSKVRRLSESDDVFSATGQHFFNHRKQRQQEQNYRLSIDTTTSLASSISDTTTDFDQDDISPTDVQSFSFPSAPPTPVKAKQSQSPYPGVRRHDPTTPMHHDRRHLTAARTPTGGYGNNNNHMDNHMNMNVNKSASKSRFYGDFDVIGELGKGSFGTVYKVLSRLDGCMYAIKAAQRKAKGLADRDRMLKEVYALAALSDQADTATFHIVRYHQAWMEDDRLYIQTELCTGTLADEIARQPNHILPEMRRYKLIREISLALEYIHSHNMVHLDIKPDNIFLKNDQFKLGDFGLVAKISYDKDVEEGDSRYMSMELLSGDHTDLTKTDIFSLGATMYEICLGRTLPMSGQEWQDIRAGRLLPMPNTSTDLALIISQMMHPQATSRPTSTELLKRKQLLSEEQKRLMAEMTKVKQANMELQAQAKKFNSLAPPRKGLQRANTWNGSSFPYV